MRSNAGTCLPAASRRGQAHDGLSSTLSPHTFGGAASTCVGEVALAAPTLGASQRLLNKDHFQVGW